MKALSSRSKFRLTFMKFCKNSFWNLFENNVALKVSISIDFYHELTQEKDN